MRWNREILDGLRAFSKNKHFVFQLLLPAAASVLKSILFGSFHTHRAVNARQGGSSTNKEQEAQLLYLVLEAFQITLADTSLGQAGIQCHRCSMF